MGPSLRKFVLALHIMLSVGWMGAASAYLVLVVAAMAKQDAQLVRAAWIGMELIGWYLIVPLALVSWLTGALMALGTPWGVFRHYWVAISLVLTTVAVVILLQHMPTVSAFARAAAETSRAEIDGLRGALSGELLHAGVGLLLLVVIEVLNVYKPQGLTAYGRRTASAVALPARDADGRRGDHGQSSKARTPRWAQVLAIHAIGLILLLAMVHVTSGGLNHH